MTIGAIMLLIAGVIVLIGGVALPFNEIIKIANDYADTMIKSREAFFEKYDYDIMYSGFSAAEWFAIGKLIDPYINCKTGKCARGETLAIQNDIKLQYERSNQANEQATA